MRLGDHGGFISFNGVAEMLTEIGIKDTVCALELGMRYNIHNVLKGSKTKKGN